MRIDVLSELVQKQDWLRAVIRPFNILAAAEKKGFKVQKLASDELNLLTQESEKQLCSEVGGPEPRRGTEYLNVIQRLAPKIDNFFESVMVMDEREDVRNARLALLGEIRRRIAPIGDVTKIVIEG